MAFTNFSFFRGDASYIVWVLFHYVGIQVVEGAAHFIRMLLIHAKDDSLGKTISTFHEFSKMASDRFATGFKRNNSLKILGVVLLVRYLSTVSVHFALTRPPSGSI